MHDPITSQVNRILICGFLIGQLWRRQDTEEFRLSEAAEGGRFQRRARDHLRPGRNRRRTDHPGSAFVLRRRSPRLVTAALSKKPNTFSSASCYYTPNKKPYYVNRF